MWYFNIRKYCGAISFCNLVIKLIHAKTAWAKCGAKEHFFNPDWINILDNNAAVHYINLHKHANITLYGTCHISKIQIV